MWTFKSEEKNQWDIDNIAQSSDVDIELQKNESYSSWDNVNTVKSLETEGREGNKRVSDLKLV